MPNKFTVEIISPDQTILKQETSEVVIRIRWFKKQRWINKWDTSNM